MPVRTFRIVLAGVLALLVLPARAQTPPQTVLFPGTTGAALLDSLARVYTPDQTLGYGPARDTLYGTIDLQPGRQLEGVYTGYTITLDDDGDPPRTNAFKEGVNTEHTWPRSEGADREPAESDMHHLFPTLVETNSERGNNPFADIPDDQTDTWWYLDQQTSSIPDTEIDLYSESTNTRFEPREQHKGNVARAMFYFYTVYRTNESFLEQQKETLRRWHYFVDPVDQPEHDRSQAIAARQGNDNPFVLDSTLVRRAFFADDDGNGNGGTDTTSLAAGDLVIVGFNSDTPRTFAFVPLVNLPAGTELLFTDNGVRADGSFRANEGTLRYTASSLVEAGTVVVYDESGSHPFEVVEGSFATSTGGDQIIAYHEDERTFLYAVNFSAGTWQNDATGSNTSALPPRLEEGVTAVAVGDADNGVYTGATDLSATEVRRRVSDAAHWQLSDDERQAMPSETWSLPNEAVPVPQPGRQHLTLSQPAPHPFHDRTTVSLVVPQLRPVRVELFDALGRRVRVLYVGRPSGATMKLDVDGADLPPGLYLLRATGAGTSATRRLVRL